jgi:hypothetical protein
MLLSHVLHRAAYAGCENGLTLSFGAGYPVVDKGVSLFSGRVVALLRVLHCTNLSKKIYYSRQIVLHDLPRPFQRWIEETYPSWHAWLSRLPGSASAAYEFGTVISADRWNHAVTSRVNLPDPKYH